MQDLAHSLQCKWRSLTELQSLVLAGKYGNSPGRLKPFDSLKVDELRQELEARGYNTTGKLKQQMQEELDSILKGVQRVLTLLVSHPQQSLGSLNLSRYEVLDCEPLHDFKVMSEICLLRSPICCHLLSRQSASKSLKPHWESKKGVVHASGWPC